jgi:hypothetical protein
VLFRLGGKHKIFDGGKDREGDFSMKMNKGLWWKMSAWGMALVIFCGIVSYTTFGIDAVFLNKSGVETETSKESLDAANDILLENSLLGMTAEAFREIVR